MAAQFSIGQVAERTRLSVHAIRYFESEGMLLRRIPRNKSGHRTYSLADIEWLLLCNSFRDSGMPLLTIVHFATLVKEGTGNEVERLELLREHEKDVRAKIAALEGDLTIISTKVQVYEQLLAENGAVGLWDPTI